VFTQSLDRIASWNVRYFKIYHADLLTTIKPRLLELEEENCELLQIVDSEKYAKSLKKKKNFDHYIILSLKTVSIESEFVQTLYMQSLSKLDQLSDGFKLKLIHLMFILLFVFSNHEFVSVVYRQGCAGVSKRTTNEQRLIGPRPSDGWIKIRVVVKKKQKKKHFVRF
jgi:hypothetical protein